MKKFDVFVIGTNQVSATITVEATSWRLEDGNLFFEVQVPGAPSTTHRRVVCAFSANYWQTFREYPEEQNAYDTRHDGPQDAK